MATMYTACLIVYPYTGRSDWDPLLQSQEGTTVMMVYDALLRKLRSKVTDIMGQWMNKTPAIRDQLTDDS